MASPTTTPTPRDNYYGQRVFMHKACNVCHGDKGEGQKGLTRSLKEGEFNYDEFKRVLLKGVGKMPSYKGSLKETEICCLYRYITENIQGKEAESKCGPCSY